MKFLIGIFFTHPSMSVNVADAMYPQVEVFYHVSTGK